jgi:hypothetical protein
MLTRRSPLIINSLISIGFYSSELNGTTFALNILKHAMFGGERTLRRVLRLTGKAV